MTNINDQVDAGADVEAASIGATDGSVATAEGVFDPRHLTLSQDFVQLVGVRKETLRVPIQRPPNQAFFVVHPDPAWRIQVAALVLAEDRETYIVDPAVAEELSVEWVPKVLVTCQTRQGGLYLWPIRLPKSDGRIDSWNESALRIAQEYRGAWIRVTPNMELGCYDVGTPMSHFPEPEWPESPDELLRKAFRDRVIDTLDHPVVQRLRGVA